jgi:hypothetical protein
MHPLVRRDLARLGQKLLKLRSTIYFLDHSGQSNPAGPGSTPVGVSLLLTTLNDTFSWWAFTARAEGPRPNCAAIALRGCLPASCLSLVTSSAVQRQWMDLAIFQPPQPKTSMPPGPRAHDVAERHAPGLLVQSEYPVALHSSQRNNFGRLNRNILIQDFKSYPPTEAA